MRIRSWRRVRAIVLAVAATALPFAGVSAQSVADWQSAVSGSWHEAGRWSTGVVPSGSASSARLSATGGPHTVTLSSGLTLGDVRITSTDASLLIDNATLNATNIHLDAGKLILRGGTISNAVISGPGRFSMAPDSGGTLDRVTLGTDLTVGRINITNGLTLADGATLTSSHTQASGGDGGPNLWFSGSQSVSGNGTLQLDGDSIYLNAFNLPQPTTLTIEPGVTLAVGPNGSGGIESQYSFTGKLINRGVIWANRPGRVFEIEGATWTNQGIFRVSAGALYLGGAYATADIGVVERTGGEIIFGGEMNNTGSVLESNAATGAYTFGGAGTMLGGTLRTRDGTVARIDYGAGPPSYTLDGVTLDGTVDVAGQGLATRNTLTMVTGSRINGAVRALGTIGGSGEITGGIADGSGVTVAAGADLRLGGVLRGSVTNQGTIRVPSPQALVVGFPNSGNFVNRGTIEAIDAGIVLQGPWSNQGLIRVHGGSLLVATTFAWSDLGNVDFQDALVGILGTLLNEGKTLRLDANSPDVDLAGRVRGGTVVTRDGKKLRINQHYTQFPRPLAFENVTIDGTVRRAANALLGQVRIDGDLTLAPGSQVFFDTGGPTFEAPVASIRGSGLITIGSPTLATPVLVGADLTIEPGITIRTGTTSAAVVGGRITNRGTIHAATPGTDLIMTDTWTNLGKFLVTDGTLQLSGSFKTDDIGLVERAGEGNVRLAGNLDNAGRSLELSTGGRPWSIGAGVITGGTLTQSVPGVVTISALSTEATPRFKDLALSANLLLANGTDATFENVSFSDTTLRLEGNSPTARWSTTNQIPGITQITVAATNAQLIGASSSVPISAPDVTSIVVGPGATATFRGGLITGADITMGPSGAIGGGPVQTTGDVAGEGQFGGDLTTPGTITVGFPLGLLSVVGALALSDTSVIELDLGGRIRGNRNANFGYDAINTSTLNRDGALRVRIAGAFQPRPFDQFDLFDGTLAGQFDSVELPPLPGSWTWDLTHFDTQGIIRVVPEPGAASLLVLATGMMMGARRRPQSRAAWAATGT